MITPSNPTLFFRILAAQLDEIQRYFDRSSQALISALDHLAVRAASAGTDCPAAALNDALADLAFAQAQETDLLSQMMRLLGEAIARLPDDTDPDRLAGHYISDRQRRVHEAVLERCLDVD